MQNNEERITPNKDTNEWVKVRNNLKQNKVSTIKHKIETKNKFEELKEFDTRQLKINKYRIQ